MIRVELLSVCLSVCFLMDFVLLSQSASDRPDASSGFTEMKILTKVVGECLAKDFVSCVKVKAIAALDKAAKAGNLPLTESLTLIRVAKEVETSNTLTENELEENLPRSLEERGKTLDNMLSGRLNSLLTTHAIRFSLDKLIPGVALRISKRKGDNDLVDIHLDHFYKTANGQEVSQGRGEGGGGFGGGKKGHWMPLIFGLKAKAWIFGTLFGGYLAAISYKAILMSALTYALLALVALKKSDHHETQTYEIVHSKGDHHRRSSYEPVEEEYHVHPLPYNSYAPPPPPHPPPPPQRPY